MLKNKQLGYLLLIVLLAATVLIAFQSKTIIVDSASVHYAPMKVTIDEEGKTRVVDHFVVTAPIDAFMQRINFNEGDSIKKGQTLFVLEPLPSVVLDPRSHAEAEATLGASKTLEKIIKEMTATAKADEELANLTFNRTTQLRKQKAVSQYELDIAKVEKRRAEAIYRAAQFGGVLTEYLTSMSRSALDYENIRQLEGKNQHFKVSSMASGKVLTLEDKSARIVKAGSVLMELGDIEQLEIEADVLSTLAVKLQPGMAVDILRWGNGLVLKGFVKRIEPAGFTKVSALGVDEQRVKVILDISTDYKHRKQLAHGFRVEIRFILWQADKVLQIPNSALFRDKENGWAVYVINANKLEKRAVQTGHRNNLMTEVIDGLAEDESVVSYLSNELMDGVKIAVR